MPLFTQPYTKLSQNFRLLAMLSGGAVIAVLSLSAHASTLISSTDYLEYELPKAVEQQCVERQNCPKIEIKYLITNHDWLNKIVNARINNLIINSAPSESPPSQSSGQKELKQAIDDFAVSQFADIPNNVPWSYNLMVTPDYLGHVKLGQAEDLEMFEINTYVFTGGAHGMPYSEYVVLNPNSKKQIKLTDILQVGKKPRFEALAYDAYKTWIKTVDEDVKNYEKSWPFTLSDNITFTDKGIDIRYQHYEIGPYAYGMPVLSIPYNKLRGIVKTNFMPSTPR